MRTPQAGERERERDKAKMCHDGKKVGKLTSKSYL